MNPQHNSNQNPASACAVQQVNPVMNQQMLNGHVAGLFPNNMPVVAPPGIMNVPIQPFSLQNSTTQFPNGGICGFNPQQNFNQFPVNQFFAYNVGLPGEQVLLLQNTVPNIYPVLQLQNPNYAQCNPGSFPMFQNPIVNVMNPQNPVNQQFVLSSANGPVQHANNGLQNMGQRLQGNPFLPGASGSVQTQQPQNLHATLTNMQNQIPQGVGPQNQNLLTNKMYGIANLNVPMQNSQGPPGFVSPMMDVNASRQIVNMGQTQNLSPTLTKSEGNHKNVPTNVNGEWNESQHKSFTGHKTYDFSHNKRSKSHNHVKQKFGRYKGSMHKEGGSNLEADSVAQNSTNFEKKVPSLTYTEQEIKEWREARKKNYPTNRTESEKHKKKQTLSDVTNQDAILRRQQLKDILAKQAELGCEVADISATYLSSPDKQNPRERKHEKLQQYNKGKFNNKRGAPFHDANRIAKKARPRDQDSFKRNHQTKPHNREPSLLQKLLTRDIKRDKTHILQVLRFMTANSFFTRESLRFPSVIVRETNVDVPSKDTTCSVTENVDVPSQETSCVTKNVDVPSKEPTCSVTKNVNVPSKETICSVIKVEVEEEEGEIID